MNQEKIKILPKTDNSAQNKFICSICLNKRPVNVDKKEDSNIEKIKFCPICLCGAGTVISEDIDNPKGRNSKTKQVQTSQTDLTHGISLLNEVLNVFQNRKNTETSHIKPIVSKDKGVNTDVIKTTRKPNLVVSEIFQYSIEDNSRFNSEGKFTVLNYEPRCKTGHVIPLSKHKSSSIPQMKLDELKHSLKDKTKSKDAIEEVNRMFATVRKLELDQNDSNRPVIRHGPRILPVVKTNCNVDDCGRKAEEYRMSSGDSGLQVKSNRDGRNQYCESERCEGCMYACCQYHRFKTDLCENCRKLQAQSRVDGVDF